MDWLAWVNDSLLVNVNRRARCWSVCLVFVQRRDNYSNNNFRHNTSVSTHWHIISSHQRHYINVITARHHSITSTHQHHHHINTLSYQSINIINTSTHHHIITSKHQRHHHITSIRPHTAAGGGEGLTLWGRGEEEEEEEEKKKKKRWRWERGERRTCRNKWGVRKRGKEGEEKGKRREKWEEVSWIREEGCGKRLQMR